ncbi:MAG: tetratricopeptide repeat protein [Anaerolineaceae bacterium]|nr:tetratricopeptide repeat protein [Anaerolineaceae bacterium]
MNTTLFFKSLKDSLNEIDQKILIESANQDKVILSKISNYDFYSQCIETFGNKLSTWTLGKIALFSIGIKIDILDKDIKEKFYLKNSISVVDDTLKNHIKEVDFTKATNIALALFERKRKNQSWIGLIDELSSGIPRKYVLTTWRTSISILYSLLNDDENFLLALVNDNDPYLGISFVNHIIATQLISHKQKATLIVKLLEKLPIETQITWLQTIPVQISILSEEIAVALGNSKTFTSSQNVSHTLTDFDDVSKLDSIFKINLLNGFKNKIENSPVQAKSNFRSAKEKLQKILQLIDLNLIHKSIDDLKDDTIKYVNDPKFNDLVFTQIGTDQQTSGGKNQDNQLNGILANLAFACEVLKNGDAPKAREIGSRQFRNWIETQQSSWPSPETLSYLIKLDHKKLIELLNKLSLNGISAEYVKFLESISIPRVDYQEEYIEGLQTLNQTDEAYRELKISLLSDINNESVYKQIFSILEKNNKWDSLYLEWEDYSRNFNLSHDDWIHFADAALEAKKYDETKKIIEKMQKEGVNETQIDMLWGKMFYREGDYEKARTIFEDTTKRLPDYEEGWIVLSEVYNKMGLIQKSLETLRSAVITIPDSPIIQFNLAKSCIDQELYAEALPYIRKAVALDPNNATFNHSLIQTLQILGRIDEADTILSQARLKWPLEPELAFAEAVRQVEKQNRDAALIAFEVSVNTTRMDVPISRLLLYVQTILGDRPEKFLPTDGKFNNMSNLLSSQRILQKALKNSVGDNQYLQIILGEIYFLIGEYEAANSLYTQLINEFKSNQKHQPLLWRVYAGLGLVKIGLSELDSGIAALQEADQLNQKHLGIKQKCAEAYLSASLLSQAEAKAEEIYELGSTVIDNLLWYSDFMTKLGKPEREIRGLEQILHFDPSNCSAITRLASIYISNGDSELASEVLERLTNVENIPNEDIRSAVISFLRIGKNEEALVWFGKISESKNGLQTKVNKFEKIYLLIINNRWEMALAEIQEIKKSTSNARIISSLEGECLFNKEDYSASVNAYETALLLQKGESNEVIENIHKGSLIPENWIQSRVQDLQILYSLSIAYKKLMEFDHSLEVINRMIKFNPSDLWIYLMGAEYAMEITDYDLVSDYLLKLKNNTNSSEWQGTSMYATAIDYACAYLDGRDYRLSINENEENDEIKKLLAAHQMLDKNLFEEATKIYDETSQSNINETSNSNKYDDGKYDDIKKSITKRLALILAWRLYDFEKTAEFLDYQTNNSLERVDQAIFKLSVNLSYKKYLGLFNSNLVKAHQSKLIEAELNNPDVTNQLLSVINRYGKTRAIKNIEQLYKVIKEKDFSTAFSLLNSKTLPKYQVFILVDELMKAGKSEIVNEYFTNFRSELSDSIFYLMNRLNDPIDELISFIENQTSSDDPLWLMTCSMIFEKGGFHDEAIDFAEQAYKIWPQEDQWVIRIAKLYQIIGDFDKADEYWAKIVESSNSTESVIYEYANLLLDNKKSSEVIQLLDHHKPNIAESFEFHFVMAKAYLLERSHENLIQSIQLARKFRPDSAEIQYLEAEAYLLIGEVEKSKNKIQDILVNNPRFEKAHILNANLLRIDGKNSDAIKLINRSLDICPDSKGLLIEKVRNLRDMKNYSEGLLITSELSQRFPKDLDVLEILANLYIDIEDFQAAEMVARKSIHLQPNQSSIHLLLGKIARKQGHLDQALDHLTKAGLIKIESIEPWLEMGDIYLEQNELEKALDAFREAISRDENDYRAFYKAGLLLRDLKDYQGAEKMLKIASSLSPKDTSIRRQLAGVIALNLVHSS